MRNFLNDYSAVGHPRVLEHLENVAKEFHVGYGYDPHTERARKLICKQIGVEKPIYFIPGGTGVNALAISFCIRPHEAVITSKNGHIVEDEVGAIEAKGHKVIQIEDIEGKIQPDTLEETLNSFGYFMNVLPGMVYISNTTELGTVYTKEEIEAIYKVCKRHNVLLYIDGARSGVAINNKYSNIAWEDMSEFCDLYYIGGTKNGALFGEALVFNNEKLGQEFNYYMKQQGLLIAKGFVLGAQFEALFTDNLYNKIATKANENAYELIDALKKVDAEFAVTPQSNQVLIYVTNEKLKALQEDFLFNILEEGEEKSMIRLVTTYRTTTEDIEAICTALKA